MSDSETVEKVTLVFTKQEISQLKQLIQRYPKILHGRVITRPVYHHMEAKDFVAQLLVSKIELSYNDMCHFIIIEGTRDPKCS